MQIIGLFCDVSTFPSSPLWNIERRDPCCLANSLFLQSWHWDTNNIIYTTIRTFVVENTFWGFERIHYYDGKYVFLVAITLVFSVIWSFRNHSYMLVWCSRNI